eukprot:763047-Hanusia_phi.AAC.2
MPQKFGPHARRSFFFGHRVMLDLRVPSQVTRQGRGGDKTVRKCKESGGNGDEQEGSREADQGAVGVER